MNRRNFLSTLVGGVAATAAVRTWPFRVYSFPTEITAPPPLDYYIISWPVISRRWQYGYAIREEKIQPRSTQAFNEEDLRAQLDAFNSEHPLDLSKPINIQNFPQISKPMFPRLR